MIAVLVHLRLEGSNLVTTIILFTLPTWSILSPGKRNGRINFEQYGGRQKKLVHRRKNQRSNNDKYSTCGDVEISDDSFPMNFNMESSRDIIIPSLKVS